MMRTHWDIIIIGAGPAGMAAACEAVSLGTSVLVLDRKREPGGQIFCAAGRASEEKKNFLGAEYARGHELVQRFLQAGATFLSGAEVWHLKPGVVYASHEGRSLYLTAGQILIATGGMERPVPVPGWTLPGVMGAGACDVLLKSASLAPTGPVIVCGNGPLILQTVLHLIHLKIPLAGVVMTGDPLNSLRAATHLPGALLRPAYLAKGMGMAVRTLLSGACHLNARQVSIRKTGDGFDVDFVSRGKPRSLKGATVLLHEGVVSESRITNLARCRQVWNPVQRYWHAETDLWGRTTVPGIRAAGDCAGVRGADAAMTLGALAGLDMCRELGMLESAERDRLVGKRKRTVCRLKAMQPFMDTLFAPVAEHLCPEDDAVVCRCVDLTAKELREIVSVGCWSPDGLKSQARPGMGTCQGRMCGPAVAEMIAQSQGLPLERLNPYYARPPLVPLSLRELAEMDIPPQGL